MQDAQDDEKVGVAQYVMPSPYMENDEVSNNKTRQIRHTP